MIAEAIDTVITLGWALLAWIAVLAAVGSVVLLTGLALGTWAFRAAWRAVTGPSWARGRLRARILARRHLRRPSGLSAPRDYDEAA